jgi:hypothetical protein
LKRQKTMEGNENMTPKACAFDLSGMALLQMQDEVDELTDIIGGILEGRAPDVRGATLAWLSAAFLAEHPPAVRPEVCRAQFEAIRLFMPLCLEERPEIDDELRQAWVTAGRKIGA